MCVRDDAALHEVQGGTARVEQSIAEAMAPKVPGSEIGALLDFLRLESIQRQLASIEDGAARARVVLKAAEMGDPLPWRACEQSLLPLITAESLETAEGALLQATQGDKLELLAEAQEQTASAHHTAMTAKAALTRWVSDQEGQRDMENEAGRMDTEDRLAARRAELGVFQDDEPDDDPPAAAVAPEAEEAAA